MDFEPSNMDLPTVVEHALAEDEKGGAARMNLGLRNTEVQVQSLLATEAQPESDFEDLNEIYPHVPNRGSVCGIDLPLHWEPKVEYRIRPSKFGGSVQIQDSEETFGTATLTLSSDQIGQVDAEEFSTAVDPYLAISDAWDDVIGTLDEDSEENPFASLPKIRHIRQSAEQQKKRYATRSEELLSLAREALLGWIVVALHDVEEGPRPPRKEYDRWLRPSQDYENCDSDVERQRQVLRDKYSRYGLFATEVSKLWEMIHTRTPLTDLQLDAIAEGLDVPEAVTEAVANVLELICSDLEKVDEEVIHMQALAGACKAIQSVIVETKKIPAEFGSQPPTSSQKTDARVLLLAVEERDPASFNSYREVAKAVDRNLNSIGLTSKEQENKSGRSIVKGGKRFAERSQACDYERSSNYDQEDLISELREADDRGDLPE